MLDLKQYLAKMAQQINQIDISQLQTRVCPETIIIDVREPLETTEGIIPGAVAIPRGVLEMQILQHKGILAKQQHVPLHKRDIYLYCRSGARSTLAAHALTSMGFENVYSINGGYQAWCQ